MRIAGGTEERWLGLRAGMLYRLIGFMNAFSLISSSYQKKAVLQEAAGQKLFDLLAIRRNDSVMDLGCGPGHLTRKIRDLATGTVYGIDPSETMIGKARRNCQALAVTFLTTDAESFDTPQTFDAIFCNSSFHWFHDPARALANCCRVLRPGGRIAIQAPARANYCPISPKPPKRFWPIHVPATPSHNSARLGFFLKRRMNTRGWRSRLA